MNKISIKLLITLFITLIIVIAILIKITEANKLTVGARVVNKLQVTTNNQLQDAISPQKTTGLDVLQYCAKDGLEWQVSCQVVVQ